MRRERGGSGLRHKRLAVVGTSVAVRSAPLHDSVLRSRRVGFIAAFCRAQLSVVDRIPQVRRQPTRSLHQSSDNWRKLVFVEGGAPDPSAARLADCVTSISCLLLPTCGPVGQGPPFVSAGVVLETCWSIPRIVLDTALSMGVRLRGLATMLAHQSGWCAAVSSTWVSGARRARWTPRLAVWRA